MKKLKKLCGAVLIAGLMLPQLALRGTDTAEASSGKWKQNGKKWWYSYSDGTYPKSKWEKIDGKWYHFDKSGYMQTGWQKISGKWYYFGTNGIMKTGWQKISGKWYYFKNGVMKTGWLKSAGKWYYFNGDGSMVTGKKTIGGKSYTFGSDGVMMEDPSTSSSGSNYAEANVGDVITFGHYEQDNNLTNGKEAIEWIVIEKDIDGGLLLLSKYVLDAQPYHSEMTDITWEKCSLRNWLNSTFYDAAFTSDEKDKIKMSRLQNENNPHFGTKGGRDTEDKVFLIDLDKAMQCFDDNGGNRGTIDNSQARSTKPTPYAIAQGVYVASGFTVDFIYVNGCCYWWLRGPGINAFHALAIGSGGGCDYFGSKVYRGINIRGRELGPSSCGVRPAIVIHP